MRVGVVLGDDGLRGATSTVRHLNLAGGIRARPVEVIVDDEYGRPLSAQRSRDLTAAGRPPVTEAPCTQGQIVADKEILVAALIEAHADLLVWVGQWDDLTAFRDAFATAGYGSSPGERAVMSYDAG